MTVWLEEARWVYQDRLARSESIHAAASSLVGAFVVVMSLPAAVVALTPGRGMAVKVLLVATAGVCGLGMIFAIVSTLRQSVRGKDLARERQVFTRQRSARIEDGASSERIEQLAVNLLVPSAGAEQSIVEAISVGTDRQIRWYTCAQITLMFACVLSAATLIWLTLTS